MSEAQERHPGTTWLLTFRIERREMRLKPTAEMSAGFAVAWQDAAERYGQQPVALHVGSNHYHAVVHDPTGRVSDFLRDAHALIARYGNALEGVRVKFWDGQETRLLELADAETVVSRTAYVLAQAVKDRLVPRVEDWPGVRTRVEDIGMDRGPVYVRPTRFFRSDGPVAEAVELVTHVPPGCEAAFGAEGFRQRVKASLEGLVAEAHAEAARDGRGFVGVARVMRQSVWDQPATPDGRTAGREAKARKRVVAASRALLTGVLERMAAFREHYRAARDAFRSGQRDVVFPAGTWFPWRFYGARRETTEPAFLAGA